jgi:rhodanese-related sulfurtransferase
MLAVGIVEGVGVKVRQPGLPGGSSMTRIDFRFRALWALPLLAVAVSACADASAPAEADVLVAHLEANAGYDVHGGFIINASEVRANLVDGASQLVLDLRRPGDFAAGHVEGAVNVSVTDLADHLATAVPAASTYETIVLICYSGQSAAWAAGVLRAMGYENVRSMRWGMAAWHEDFAGVWVRNRTNVGVAEWVAEPAPAPDAVHAPPMLATGLPDGPAILDARGRSVLAEGFLVVGMSPADALANPDALFIVNVWPAELYRTAGHVPGAANYDPAARPFLTSTRLRTLPPNRPVVLYCWTGQSSAYMAGYLRVLGYDARTLLFGTNGMIYDRMVADGMGNAFDPAGDVMNYDYEM